MNDIAIIEPSIKTSKAVDVLRIHTMQFGSLSSETISAQILLQNVDDLPVLGSLCAGLVPHFCQIHYQR